MVQWSLLTVPVLLLLKCQREVFFIPQNVNVVILKWICGDTCLLFWLDPCPHPLSLCSSVSRGRWGWCTAWRGRAARRRCTTTNRPVLLWRSSFICSGRGFGSRTSLSTELSWTPRVRSSAENQTKFDAGAWSTRCFKIKQINAGFQLTFHHVPPQLTPQAHTPSTPHTRTTRSCSTCPPCCHTHPTISSRWGLFFV